MQESAHPRGVIATSWIAAALTAAVVVLVDQWTKMYFIAKGETFFSSIVPNVLDLTYHENQGIIANVPLPNGITIAITIAILIVLIAAITRLARDQKNLLAVIALAEIFGGAIGNLIDRLHQGFVFDWILFFGRSVMNIADLAIIEGAIVFILWRWMKRKQTKEPSWQESDFSPRLRSRQRRAGGSK